MSLEIWLSAPASSGLTTATTHDFFLTALTTRSIASAYSLSVTFRSSESNTMMSCSAPAAVKSDWMTSVTSAESDPVTL